MNPKEVLFLLFVLQCRVAVYRGVDRGDDCENDLFIGLEYPTSPRGEYEELFWLNLSSGKLDIGANFTILFNNFKPCYEVYHKRIIINYIRQFLPQTFGKYL